MQENMELGLVGDHSNPLDVINGSEVDLDFEFKPGFQIGAGMNLPIDHWDIYCEYTWVRGSHHVATSLDPTNSNVALYPAWVFSKTSVPRYFFGKEKWSLHMDLLDAELGRSYFVGKNLTFRPFFGMRAPWIRQRATVEYLNNLSAPGENTEVRQSFHSWGIGPKAGVSLDWLLGCGIRMYGKGEADIVYTQYRKLRFFEQATNSTGAVVANSRYIVNQANIGYLRPHMDLALGLGWGTYFYCNRWHIDLSADYGFQVFFNQNMFRNFTDDQALGKSIAPNGDLYIQGLTATLRLDF